MTKTQYLLRVFLLTIISSLTTNSEAFSQVSGQIIADIDNTPLIGASVTVKGTSTGTVSDYNGDFAVLAKQGDTLVISYIGYTTKEIEVFNTEKLLIRLAENNNLLSDVVIVGYSSKTKKEVSASLTTLSSSELQNVTSSNVETMLQGKVPGLTVSNSSGAPGAVADLRIRGITSINADQPPLFVVDGIIGGTFIPNDVESLTVLKDAAAIGLYGAAGAAGVIVVTTKKGKTKEPLIAFSTTTGVKEAVTGNFQMMNGEQLYAAQEKMWGAENRISFLNNRPQDLEDLNFDWLDAGFNRGYLQNYNLSVRGSSDDLNYALSADYYDESGTFINTDFQRVNLRANLKFKATQKFTIQSDINAQFSQDQSQYFSWFEDVFWNMPWDNPYAENGELLGPQYVTDPSNDWYGQFRRSFLFSTQFNSLGSEGSSIVWSNIAKYDFTDWLSIETRTRLNSFNSKFNQYYAPNTDEGLATNGAVGSDRTDGFGASATTFLRFSKNYGRSELAAFVAHEGGYSKSSSLNFYGENLASSTISVPSGASIPSGSGSEIEFKGISYISEITYGLDNTYFATAYFRRDGSSLFAENNRFGNFYGGSVGWLMSNTSFLKDINAIDLFKIRASYGLTGNSNIPPFLDLATYNITRQYNSQPAGEPNNPANPLLGWETTRMTNVGVDLELYNNAIEFSVDLYQKSVEGMLLNNPLPFSSGYQSRTENIGDMRNRGVELSLTHNKFKGDFTVSSNFNFAFNKNEITKITDVLDQQSIQAGAIQQINVVGEEAFQWYMPKWLGVNPDDGSPIWEQIIYDDSGNEVDRVSTGVYSDATFQPNGSAIPSLTGGFNQSFSYKNIGLSYLLTFQTGNEIYHYTRQFVDSDGANVGINLMQLNDGWSRWENPGDQATHPVLNRGGSNGAHQTSSRYIESGNYLRLRNVNLSYNLGEKLSSKLNVSATTLSISADNLYTFSNFSGMDPDVGFSVSAFSLPGLSYLKYPINKQILVSLKIEL